MALWRLESVFFLAYLVSLCAPVFAASAEQLIERAEVLEKEGSSAEAISYIDQATAKGLKRPGIYWLRGYCNQDMGKHREAVADFSAALALAEQRKKTVSGKEKILSSRGSSYMALKQDDKALADFSASLAINNTVPAIHVSRGNVYLRLKQYQRAIDDYSEAMRMRVVLEDKGRVLISRAKAYEALGKYNMARMDRLQVQKMEKDFDIDGNISLHKR